MKQESRTLTPPRRFKIASESGGAPWHVEWYDEIDSTMSRAAEMAAAGAPARSVVVADYQSAGRGTHGRSWVAPPGTCLMFSVILQQRIELEDLPELPRRIAQALSRALQGQTGLPISVKDPNDLLIGGKKLAGVLCQSHIRSERVEWIICGIGLNTNLSESEITVPGSTSLRIESGGTVDHRAILEELLGAFDRLQDDADSVEVLARAET
ncbi:MAG: biotin--[acetyl-CoA-carboxylase] ligase [Thermomicrobiales bacterium]